MKRCINLMSAQARRRECYRTRFRQWCGVLAGISVVLCLIVGERYWSSQEISQQLFALEAKYEPISQLKAANKLLTKQIAAIRDEEQFVLMLSDQEPTATLLGVLGSAIAEVNNRVFLEKIELRYVATAKATAETGTAVVDLVGIANSGPAVNQFAESLQFFLPFGKVDITSTREYHLKQQSLQDFSMQLTY